MGNGSAKGQGQRRDTDAAIRSQRIDQSLIKDKRAQSKIIKLLLLGGSESGKSTIIKQMKIIHMKGFGESDLISYRYLIHANVTQALTQILNGMNKLNINPDGIMQDDLAKFKMVSSCTNLFLLTPSIGHVMYRLWTSRGAQACYERRHEIELMDSTKYLLDNLQRISAPRYMPTYQDVLRGRTPTVGIYEVVFSFKSYEFRLVDVGGQKTERRKWIHVFDNVTSILFVSSLAEYDLTLIEDNSTNRLHDSLALFASILRNSCFEKSSIMLFLNKSDIFAEKIRRIPLKVCFPDYEGPDTYNETTEYILTQFVRRKPIDKPMYSHFTVATDTKNIELVFAASTDTILMKTLTKLNVM